MPSSCHEALNWIARERDQPLRADDAARLHAHLSDCPACARARADMAAAGQAWRQTTLNAAAPDEAVAWVDLQQRLADRSGRRSAPKSPRSVQWIPRWAGIPLAAAAVLVVLFHGAPGGAGKSDGARAEYVEAGDQQAATVVYVDDASGWLIVWASAPSGT